MAAVLAELSRHCFTGLGLSFGAATSELVVAHRGIELLMCSIPKGGDWLDEQLAQEFGDMLRDDAGEPILDLAKSETRRRSAERLLSPANDDTDCFLAGLHRDLIYSLIRSATFALASHPRATEIPQPLPAIIVGGVSRIAGFEDLLWKSFELARFPLAIREIRFSTRHDFTVARGGLINAQLESEIRQQQLLRAREWLTYFSDQPSGNMQSFGTTMMPSRT